MENNTFDACHPIALTPFYSKALHSFERILETWKTYWHGEKPYCAGTLFLKRKFNWQLDCHKWMSLYIEQQAFSFITSRISSTGRHRKKMPHTLLLIFIVLYFIVITLTVFEYVVCRNVWEILSCSVGENSIYVWKYKFSTVRSIHLKQIKHFS